MKKQVYRYILTIIMLMILRFIYVLVMHVPFFEGVFISTSIGLILAEITADIILLKMEKSKK